MISLLLGQMNSFSAQRCSAKLMLYSNMLYLVINLFSVLGRWAGGKRYCKVKMPSGNVHCADWCDGKQVVQTPVKTVRRRLLSSAIIGVVFSAYS